MEKFEINILGCGSAVPSNRHMTTAQLVNVHEKVFLVDCGEGTQTQIWNSGLKVTNMNHIFISHAHGEKVHHTVYRERWETDSLAR